MKIKSVLFDLDGTLLPMDQKKFTHAYLHSLASRISNVGYEPKKLMESILLGTAAMIKNDGKKTNEQVFWDSFAAIYGDKVFDDVKYFEDFYEEDFDKVKDSCGYNPRAAEVVSEIKGMGLRVTLATNPLFPKIATVKRAKWAGLNVADFELITTYENSRYCKPNLKYYQDVVSAMNIKCEETLMVGNDVDDDMIAKELGMKVFLLTDNLINNTGKDISEYPNGNFDDLLKYVKSLS